MIREGDGTLDIGGIHVVGQWVASATLMKSLLAIWMGTSFVVLLGRVCCLRKELSDRAESEQELLLANNQLASQSKEMSEMACRDPLTGLFNRRGVQDSIANHMDEWVAEKKRFAVITLDIDHFKRLNDTHGHAHGDAVLCELSRTVTNELRSRDVIARWGGEEFLVICAGASETAAANLAERLRKKFASGKPGFTCSFGISESAEGADFEKILERADLALYRSKTNGRDQVTTFTNLSASVTETLSKAEPTPAERAQR
jgi:diguanylate cyclase (GGDEF)-like protein